MDLTVNEVPMFYVLTAASMMIFWDMAPCSLVELDQRFRGAYCLHYQGDDGGSTRPSETSVYFYETTLRHVPKGCNLNNETVLSDSIVSNSGIRVLLSDS
jgi:hypothetical protein